MSFQAKSVALLGLGLISGSLGRALRKSEWQGELIGWGPRAPSLERGVELGVIDRFSLDLDEVLADADMIVIGAPPIPSGDLAREVLEKVAAMSHRPVVTDLASIKGYICDKANSQYAHWVPGHPIAGSEHSGVAASKADLFAGREIILTPTDNSAADAVAAVTDMWLLTGARVTSMPVADHDAALAASSHSPHMLAYALTMALSKDPLSPMQHGGGALRDMTRIAGSDPVMWRDIALTNRAGLLKAMDDVSEEIAVLRAAIDRGDADAIENYFAVCREVRRGHDDVLNPMLETNKEKQTK